MKRKNVGRPKDTEHNKLLSTMWRAGKTIEEMTIAGGYANAHVTYQRITMLRKLYGKRGTTMFPKRAPGRKK